MKKQIIKIIAAILILSLLSALCGCFSNSLTGEELKALYAQAIENSLKAELYFWKESINTRDGYNFSSCNVYAELDGKYEPLREPDGSFSNMNIDVSVSENTKNTYKALCGKSQSSTGNEAQGWLFENGYNASGAVTDKKKTQLSPQAYVLSADFSDKYSLAAKLEEFAALSVDDMDFSGKNAKIERKGNVVQYSFEIKDSYLESYEKQFGRPSVFAGSKYASMELCYERFASIVIYTEEKLGTKLTVDSEAYKLEVSYFGPIVKIPSYDGEQWKDA